LTFFYHQLHILSAAFVQFRAENTGGVQRGEFHVSQHQGKGDTVKKSFVSLVTAGVTALSGTILPMVAAHAESACYVSGMFPDERLVIDAEKQGVIVSNWYDLAALLFGGKQTAYSVHGKHVVATADPPPTNWLYWMAAATGTVDVSVPFWGSRPPGLHGTDMGAHMGLVAQWVRGDGEPAGVIWALPVTFDCGSVETSPTPSAWECQVYNEFGVYWGTVNYTKVAITADDPRCNLFQALPGDRIHLFRAAGDGAPVLTGPASFGPQGLNGEAK
jgi:hypothetical protein